MAPLSKKHDRFIRLRANKHVIRKVSLALLMAIVPGGLLLGCLFLAIGFFKRKPKKDKDHEQRD